MEKKKAFGTSGCIKRQKGNGINNIGKECRKAFVYAVVFLATCLISNYPAAIFAFAFVHLIYKTSIKEY